MTRGDAGTWQFSLLQYAREYFKPIRSYVSRLPGPVGCARDKRGVLTGEATPSYLYIRTPGGASVGRVRSWLHSTRRAAVTPYLAPRSVSRARAPPPGLAPPPGALLEREHSSGVFGSASSPLVYITIIEVLFCIFFSKTTRNSENGNM